MHSAGQRKTKPPERYNPSLNYPSPVLPATDFDLTMSANEDIEISLSQDSPLSLVVLEQRINDIANSFHAQLDNVTRKFVELDTRIDELCLRIDDNDTDTTSKLAQVQTSFKQDFLSTQNNISRQQHHLQETQKSNAHTHHTISESLKALADRVSMVEGHAARITALENKKFISDPPTIPQPYQSTSTNFQFIPQASFNNLLTSTTMASPFQSQSTTSLHTSNLSAPPVNNTLPSNIMPSHNSTTFLNTSGINFDTTKLPTYDGNLSPVHPEEFIEQAEQYFLTQPPVPDQVKINYIKSKFIDGAHLWYTTLLPPPSVYTNFLTLFRNHFWSSNRQRAIRNELYRPYFHRDNTSLQKHAMDWISKARFLQPPIDQAEMVDQITSHFSFNISVALRGLRITTTNELIQQLSYLQPAHSSSDTQNIQSNPPSQTQNSYHNSVGPNNQNRYPTRQNNYNRSQHSNNNNAPPPPRPDQSPSPPGNAA